jgi:hypothetical protein
MALTGRQGGRHWCALALAASIALLASGCIPPDWTVYVSSSASTDVIVRITYDGGGRDVLVKAGQEEDVVSLPDPRPPARVSLLDPKTCAVLASSDLPTSFPIVAFDDDNGPGKFSLEVGSRDVGQAGDHAMPSADNRCAGR